MEIEVKKSNREHSFDVELASIVGLEKAILIKNISYWIEENKRRNETGSFANGIWWTEESLTSLAKKYPYFKRTSIGRWMQELHDLGWIRIVVGKSGKNRYSSGKVFELWDDDMDWKSLLSQNRTVAIRPKMRQQPSQNETANAEKVANCRPILGRNNIDTNRGLDIEENIEISPATAGGIDLPLKSKVVEEKKPEGKNIFAGPAKKSEPWTKTVARIFDQVNEKKHAENRLEYLPFNWKVCAEENFKHLKNLREKAIAPDFKTKHKKEPSEEDLATSFKAVFGVAWDYFYKIQKSTGGALCFTPTNIYKSYNKIKSSLNGNSKNTAATQSALVGAANDPGKFDSKWGY